MTSTSPTDVVTAAMSIAKDAAEGRLAPTDLQTQAVAELRELFGTVVGPDDPAWPVQLDVARQVLAAGGIPADELSEWLAVARHRAGEPLDRPESPDPDMSTAEPDTAASGPHSPGNVPELAELDLPADVQSDPQPEPDAQPQLTVVTPAPAPAAPPRPVDGEYDPLAHWPASRTLPRP
ncbi:flagellar hook-length control protein [Mycobacterium intracellulare]|uniref:flagellar hook-length control protein n=1 Tax=Mycobacterium intracellulare TaxID=1767 RepID=UPI003557E136